METSASLSQVEEETWTCRVKTYSGLKRMNREKDFVTQVLEALLDLEGKVV